MPSGCYTGDMLTIIIRGMGISGVAIFAALAVSIIATAPGDLGPFGLTVWFCALLIGLANAITLMLYKLRRRRAASRGSPTRKSDFALALRRGSLAAIWVTGIVALSSLRQLAAGDIILLTVFVLAVEFYMRRMRT